MYLSMGDGQHVDENRFAVLSAARFLTPDAGWRIELYTDRPELFEGLPVQIRTVDASTAEAWNGPHRYVYRSTIMALADCLAAPDVQRAAIVDGDTYVRRSPERLFARIAPGSSVMHVREGRPAPPEVRALEHVLGRYRPVDSAGRPWPMSPTEPIWNAGVIGLHRDDRGLCDEALLLTDQLLDHGFGELSHTAEMIGWNVPLGQRTRIRECFDVVMHYWRQELRAPFVARLQETWNGSAPDPALFDQLWEARPRESLERHAKFRIKRLAAKVGVEL